MRMSSLVRFAVVILLTLAFVAVARQKVLILGLQRSHVSAADVKVFDEALRLSLCARGFGSVTIWADSQRAINAAGFEAMDCGDDPGAAAAIGAKRFYDKVIIGRLSEGGGRVKARAEIIDVRSGLSAGQASEEQRGTIKECLPLVADELAAALVKSSAENTDEVLSSRASSHRLWGLVTAGSAVGAGVLVWAAVKIFGHGAPKGEKSDEPQAVVIQW